MIYYLGVHFSRETNEVLHRQRAANNWRADTMPSLGFHTTIAYSTTPFRYIMPSLPASTYTVKDVALFGTSLVLLYDSEWLQGQHRLTLGGGATWDHPEYQPHITIAEKQTTLDGVPPYIRCDIKITELFYKEYP